MHRASRDFLNSPLTWNGGTPTMDISPLGARPLQSAQDASSSSFAGFQMPPTDGLTGTILKRPRISPDTTCPSATIQTGNFLSRFLARFSRPTQLESSVLEKTCAMLDEAEGQILQLQIQLATIWRHPSGRTIEFRYRKRPPSIRRFANCMEPHRAAELAVRGSVTSFSTVATVRLAAGVLSSLEFDMIPWAAHEPLEIESQFSDLGEPAANGGYSHTGKPNSTSSPPWIGLSAWWKSRPDRLPLEDAPGQPPTARVLNAGFSGRAIRSPDPEHDTNASGSPSPAGSNLSRNATNG